MNPFRPREVASSIFAIDFERLFRRGMRTVLFDLDKTLKDRGPSEVEPSVLALLARLSEMGFRIGILTNRRPLAADPALDALVRRYPLHHTARKPSRKGFLALLQELGTSPREAVMVGDHLLTDIFGANRLGIYSIRILSTSGAGRGRRAGCRPGC
jgi:hypothetical protein